MSAENGSADRLSAAPAPDSKAASSAADTSGNPPVGKAEPGQNGPGTAREPSAPDSAANGSDRSGEAARPAKLQDLVDEPAKVMRIGTMIKQLLEEVRNAPLDDAARSRLAEIHERSLTELEDGLAPELVEELHRVNLPFLEAEVPTDAELRIAQAQLVGWLEGLFRGIQTAIAAQQTAGQQMASRLQLRQLPPGTVLAPGVVIGDDGEPRRAGTGAPGPAREGTSRPEPHSGPGQYL